MPVIPISTISGLNTYLNPLNKGQGELIRAVNVDSSPYGGKSKRTGYDTYLGTADGSAVQSLFSWRKEDGTTLYTYRASGSALYYSVQGTGAWTVAGNGTISPGAHVGYAVLGNTLVIGDGIGSTRHTTDGTSFTNTTLAPIASDFVQYQRRIYAMGTSSTLFYSTTNDATNWQTSGTSDSSSFTIPGDGKLTKIFKIADRLHAVKSGGNMFKWDGYSLIDMATNLAMSSPYSYAETEGYGMWINRLGHFGYGGSKPQLLSNAVQRQFYNNAGSGVVGSVFDTIPAGIHRYDYFASLGTVTDDFVGERIDNAILKYDYQKNEYLNYKFAHFPTAYHSYRDAQGVQQMIFGNSSGQCYIMNGTSHSDNGEPIEAIMEFVVRTDNPYLYNKWNWAFFFFNPGNQAKIQIAYTNTYQRNSLNWIDLGDASSGILDVRFPQGARSKLMFVRISESSTTSQLGFYGMYIDFDPIPQ